MKEGSEGGLKSISLSSFIVLDKVDTPNTKGVNSAPLPRVCRESGT